VATLSKRKYQMAKGRSGNKVSMRKPKVCVGDSTSIRDKDIS